MGKQLPGTFGSMSLFNKTSYIKVACTLFIYSFLAVNNTNASDFPTVYIHTFSKEIGDDYIPAQFRLVEHGDTTLESIAGIRLRGATSRTFPKKSFRLEFWTDTSGLQTQDVSLLNMRSDDDWNLGAMYNEPLRINAASANELWLQINSDNGLSGNAKNGISSEYVQVYLNDEFHGVYILTERVDRKQLDINTTTGELYKTFDHSDAALFRKAHPYDNQNINWDGIEWRYPEDYINWDNLYEFIRFATESENYEFYLNYKDYLDYNNFIDYYILLNLLALYDNTGKNIFIGRQDERGRYFYVPWDLDGSFGFFWDGNFNANYRNILTNGLYDRLINDCYADGFVEHLQNRWERLRYDVVTEENMHSILDKNYQYLSDHQIYQKEFERWNEIPYYPHFFNQMKQWVSNRIPFLDEYFAGLCKSTDVSPEKLSSQEILIFPNPAQDYFNIRCNFPQSENIVEIYQLNGQRLLSKSFSQNLRISTEGWAKGMYLVRILNEGLSVTERVIVQ